MSDDAPQDDHEHDHLMFPRFSSNAAIHLDIEDAKFTLNSNSGAAADDEKEPPSPITYFERKHAMFRALPSGDIAEIYAQVVPGVAYHSRRKRAMSLTLADDHFVKFGKIVTELALNRKAVEDKDANIKLAAAIGQELLQKNSDLEELSIQLKEQVERLERDTRKLEKQLDVYKGYEEEIKKNSERIDEESEDILESFSLAEFLKDELESTREGYVGDANADLVAFRRKLYRERRKTKINTDLYHEDVKRLIDEKEDAVQQAAQLKEKYELAQRSVEENEELHKSMKDLNDRLREKDSERLELIERNRKALRDAKELENNAQKEIKSLEGQVIAFKEKSDRERFLSDSKLQSLNEKLAQSVKREKQLQDELEALRKRSYEALEKIKASAGVDSVIERSKLEAQLEELQQTRSLEKAAFEAKIDELTTLNQTLQGEIEHLKKSRTKQDKEIADLRKKLESFKEVGMSLRTVIEKEKQKKEKTKESHLSEKSQLEKKIAQLEKIKEAYREEKNQLEQKINRLSHDLQEVEQKREEMGDQQDKELEDKYDNLLKEKATLEVQLMVLKKRDESRLEELKRKDDEIRRLREKADKLASERHDLEQKFSEIEKSEKEKFQSHRETLEQITRQLQILMKEYSKKKAETNELQAELAKLKDALDEIDEVKNAKTKYKDMGKKMLKAMKQLDAELKDTLQKLEEAQKELRTAHRENRKLQRKNEELSEELQLNEKQMQRLMKICITGTMNEE